jgi:hypothetical protein
MKPSSPKNRVDGFTTSTVTCLFCNTVSTTDTDQFHHRHRQFHWRHRILNFCRRQGRRTKLMSDDHGYSVSHSGAQAPAFSWTARELFGLHPVSERPAAKYSRLSRVDDMGLVWLLGGRPVIALTATEAILRCQSGATLKFYRRTKPAPVPPEIVSETPAVAEIDKSIVTAEPATAIVTTVAIVTPAAAKIAKAKTVIPVVGGKTIPMPLDMEPMS